MYHLLKIMSHRLFQHFNNIFFYIFFIYFVSFIYEQPLLVHSFRLYHSFHSFHPFRFMYSFHFMYCMVIEFLYYLHHQVYILYFHYFNMAIHWAILKYHFQCPSLMSIKFVLKVIHSLKFVNHQVSY